MSSTGRFVRTVSVSCIAAFFGHPVLAAAQSYPNKPVRVIVAFAAGGFADGVTRQVAQKLRERLGQHFVVDNRGGAGGNVGARIAVEAVPDGYALLAADRLCPGAPRAAPVRLGWARQRAAPHDGAVQ